MLKFSLILITIILSVCGFLSLFLNPSLQAQSPTTDLPMTVINETESKNTNSNQITTTENSTTIKPKPTVS